MLQSVIALKSEKINSDLAKSINRRHSKEKRTSLEKLDWLLDICAYSCSLEVVPCHDSR